MASFKRTDRHIEEVTLLPLGRYWVKCESAVERATKANDGVYIDTKFVVTRGEHEGSAVWMRFNIENPSAQAVTIGEEQLTLWAAACRQETSNTDDLVGIEFEARIGTEKDSEKRTIRVYFRDGKQLRLPPRPVQQPAWSDNAREQRAAAKTEASSSGEPSEANPPPRSELDDDPF